MPTTLNEAKNAALVRTGFFNRSGDPMPGLLDPDSARLRPDTDLRYSRLFATMGSDPECPDLVYESPNAGGVPGVPCGYIKTLLEPSQHEIATLRQRLWNCGQVPTFWVITPQNIRVYDAFARPEDEDRNNRKKNLIRELTETETSLNEDTWLGKRDFDNGNFWSSMEGGRLNSRQRVDQSLLRDLQAAERLLSKYNLATSSAHALLCQTVFVKYLEDRGILKPDDFSAHGEAGEFKELLLYPEGVRSLFRWLRERLNGDLFNFTGEILEGVSKDHLDIISKFLSGHSMRNYPNTQTRLWPYSFEIIPIELVSSIYEMFAHSESPRAAKARSVHYTKLGLAGMLLSVAMQDIPKDARVLDPACGSGVFLVQAFRRLAWEKSREEGRQLSASELAEILTSQIYGLDLDSDAVYVTAFSLYLALMEMTEDPGWLHDFGASEVD